MGEDNADAWFRQIRNWSETEGIFWVIEILMSEDSTKSTRDDDTVLITAMKDLSLGNPLQGSLSNAAAFRQKDAKSKY